MKLDELPTFKHFIQDVKGFKLILRIYRLFRFFGLKNKKLDEMKDKVDEISSQLKEHKEYATKFNKYFSDEGWIVHDSINFEVMKKAVESFEVEGKEKAQKILLDYFGPENIEKNIFRLKFCNELKDRYRFIEFALEDYKEGKLYSTIPLLIMVIDGAVQDAISRGFHAKNIDLSAWDSITSVDNGIGKVKNIFQKSRMKTTTEQISSPYRHGIMHGRDLAYDNNEVAAKCWCFLFVVHDWIRSKSTEEKRKAKFIKDATPPSFKELVEQMKHTQEIKDKIEVWQPREISDLYIKEINEGKMPDNCLPEYTAYDYFKLWIRKNYGYMSNLYSVRWEKSARELRERYDVWDVENFEIISIRDESPAITEVWIRINCKDNTSSKCKLRLIYETEIGDPLPRNMGKANWKIVILDIKYD